MSEPVKVYMTPKKLRFIEAYFAAGCVGAEAYRRAFDYAGPNADVLAGKMLRNPHVRAAIELRRRKALEEAEAAEVLNLRESLAILSGIARRPSAKDADRIRAVGEWGRITGQDSPMPNDCVRAKDATVVVDCIADLVGKYLPPVALEAFMVEFEGARERITGKQPPPLLPPPTRTP